MTSTDVPTTDGSHDDVARGEAFYQSVLDTDTRDVPVSLRASSAKHLEPEGIVPSRYFDADFERREAAAVWGHVWQMACREEQIPEVGDSIVYEVADLSMIVVRIGPEEIRAFHNSCPHRGTQLRTRSGRLQHLRCPYHGFSWHLDGSLEEVPCGWDFPQIDPDDFCLPEGAVGTWGGFVFVHPDPGADPLDEFLEVLPEHFEPWPLEDRYLKAHIVRTVACNWKVALEAFIEAFHTMAVHPQLLPTAADSMTQYDIYGPNTSRMITAVGISSDHLSEPLDDAAIVAAMAGERGRPTPLEPGATAREVLADKVRLSLSKRSGADFSARSDAELLDGIEYFLFPNFMPWAGFLTPFAYRFRPDGHDPDSSIIDIMVLEPVPEGGERPAAAPTRVLGEGETWADVPELGVFGRVFNQDGATFGRVQRGLKASVLPSTVLARYQESRIRHFHATLDTYLDASR